MSSPEIWLQVKIEFTLIIYIPYLVFYIQKISHKLLELGMYDFVGTDTHRSSHLEIMKKVAINKNIELLKNLLDRNSVFKN